MGTEPPPEDRGPELLRAFLEREAVYRAHGYDRFEAARQVVAAGGTLRGPALDVGTGRGLFAIELARAGAAVWSIDLDEQFRELSRFLAAQAGVKDRVTFVTGDAARLDRPDGFFGCAGMMDVLHHLPEPGPVLGEMARTLGDGGVMVIADFSEEGFELISRVHREVGGEHPRTTTTVAQAGEFLTGAGLSRVSRTEAYFHDVIVFRKGQG